ncbi:MAG TPA: hypothetical protein DCY98_10505 [Nitrospinae bacterium]|nr:hypothetical protein [Nitrospinota bacterium]
MNKLKNIFLTNKQLILSVLIHAGLMWASLAFAYNSYKEYFIRTKWELPFELKSAIKATFPWTIIVFAVLFLLYNMVRDRKHEYPSYRQYVAFFILQALIVNFIFLSKGVPILIVQNLALLYLAIFLFIWGGIKRFMAIDTTGWAEELLPSVIYKPLQNNMPKIREYCKAYSKKKSSTPFVIGFIVLLMICAFLLIFKQEKAGENLANIAYFLLVIGVGIEIYKLIKNGNTDEEKQD